MIAGFNVGCSEEPETVLEQPSTDDTNIVDGVAEGSPLYLRLGIQWEGDDEKKFTTFAGCYLDKDASPPSYASCKVTIPEGQLYYSNLNFKIGTFKPESCPILSFAPYYYQRSNSNAYVPPGATDPIDCSQPRALNDAKCYGGAAPTIMGSDFPQGTGYYFLSTQATESSFKLASENKTQWYGGLDVNYLATNDLIAGRGSTVVGGANERVGGTWQDYHITCSDRWGHLLYDITLIIEDEDKEGIPSGVEDEFTDWF